MKDNTSVGRNSETSGWLGLLVPEQQLFAMHGISSRNCWWNQEIMSLPGRMLQTGELSPFPRSPQPSHIKDSYHLEDKLRFFVTVSSHPQVTVTNVMTGFTM